MTVSLSSDLNRGRDTHANRPAATAVPAGAYYSCSTHNLVYRSDGSTWSTWATLTPPGGTTGQALVKNSGTDYDVAWGTVSGGGGGSTVKDPRWNVLAGQTTIDEFNDASLAAAWVRVDGTGAASGNVTWTENGDALSAYNIGGDTTDKFHALLYPLSSAGGSLAAGDGVVTCVEMWAPNLTNNSFAGPVFTDGTTFGSGNQVWAELGVNSVAPQYQAFSWTGFGTAGTNAGAITGPVIGKTYIRLSMLSANTWRADYSRDGISWIKGSANLSKTLTPTHVGFFDSSYGTSTQHIASYEFIRRVSGVT